VRKRIRKDRREIAISEAELAAMTDDLEGLHHDVGEPAMSEHVAEWREELLSSRDRGTSRRTFLMGAAGAVAGGAAFAVIASHPGLAAAAARSSESASNNPTNSQGGITGLSGDLAVAALAASLENLAVYTYTQGAMVAQAGKLGTVPPAVLTFVTTVKGQHQQHADAWNAVLQAAGKHAVTVTTPSLTPTVNADLSKVATVTDLANLALMEENGAAQTYQLQSTRLQSKKAIALSSSIQPVEMQHAAILYYALGKYPGAQSPSGQPLAFSPTAQAVS
jgi:hypothetical protein